MTETLSLRGVVHDCRSGRGNGGDEGTVSGALEVLDRGDGGGGGVGGCFVLAESLRRGGRRSYLAAGSKPIGVMRAKPVACVPCQS